MINEFYKICAALKFNYEQSRYKIFLKFTLLGQYLSATKYPNFWRFFQLYLNSSGFTKSWFIGFIQDENQKTEFNKMLFLTQALKEKNLFGDKEVEALIKSPDQSSITEALLCLEKAELLTPENIALLISKKDVYFLLLAMSNLHYYYDILNQETFNAVATYFQPDELAGAIYKLHQANILTSQILAQLRRHREPRHLAEIYAYLKNNEIFTRNNQEMILHYPKLYSLSRVLGLLHDSRILNQENFNALIHPAHSFLLSSEADNIVWARIPRHLLNTNNFQALILATQTENPRQRLQDVVNQIIAGNLQVAQMINNIQSTHTSSVHQSVSESALKLRDYYGQHVNIENEISAIKTFIGNLPNDRSIQVKAAKNCILRITHKDYHYRDSSGISIRQLLALIFKAIHDDENRIGNLDDALNRFIKILYEIQRGYNINEQGIDDLNPEDHPICISGCFNKIIETLWGIHPATEIQYITKALAGLKLPVVVKEVAFEHLTRLSEEQDPKDFAELISKLKTESLEPIWEQIKENVSSRMFAEFGVLFGNNPNHEDFIQFIECGSGIELKGLERFERQETVMCDSTYTLWANRHNSPQTRHAFDRQFGLIPRF